MGFFCNQKTAYEIRISDWSSDVCSSDLDHIVARGDLSLDGLRRKAEWVLGEMERRMSLLGSSWAYTTAAQLYTVHDAHPIVTTVMAPRGAMRHGLTWHFCRPTVVDLEFERACRGVHVERVLE